MATLGCSDDASSESSGDEVDTGTDDTAGDEVDTSTSGEEASTSADTSSEETTDGPPPDEDEDGVADEEDNCVSTANPNQLDFDGDGMGNACDTTVMSMAGGTAATTGSADAGLAGNCEIPLDLEVTGGEVELRFDDDASLVGVQILSLTFADVLDKECKLNAAITANVSLTDLNMVNAGSEFPVSFAHNLADHDAGVAVGTTNIPHPVLTTGVIEAALGEDEPMPSDLELDGNLPPMDVSVQSAGATLDLTFNNESFVIATDTFTVTDPIQIDIEFELRGLVGTINLTP
ncbi:hypothetical protein G6O69_04675 [Pseudenhygromyxa sp. WMMC2535]|uniref:hypothetical protein n=1 Tax=Pseudenhygromyxa sp. WMMC2535 TaxID=2712867 RepID=UPI001556C7A4|nr:hypothetical protein [Pseudenhygromyxa sp. WMMC2535]NVB37113.1 hypothetical protein [Pseudenhygromyxa sp. WMMC2535]